MAPLFFCSYHALHTQTSATRPCVQTRKNCASMQDVEKRVVVSGTPCSNGHATLDAPRLEEGNDNQILTANSSIASSNASLDDTSSHDEFPEGGPKGYLAVLGAFLALFCTFGQMNSFGTYEAYYSENQLEHLSSSTISWIGSLQLWIFFFSGGFVGQLFDKFGPTWLMSAGSLVFIFSIMMTSLSSQYYQYILTQGILFGLGVGLLFYPSLASVSTHFYKYRATALGVAAAGSSVGGVVYPIMLQHLFPTVGFGWAVRISGFVSALCCITAVFTVTRCSSTKSTLCISFKTFADVRYLLLAFGSCLVALGLFIPFFYIVKYAFSIGISEENAFYVLAVMNAGGVFGRIAPAYVSDTLGRFNTLIPSAFFSGLTCLAIWIVSDSLSTLMVFAALYGFFSGSFISVITPCVAQISDIRQIGIRMGMLYSVISFPSLVGGPAAGTLLVREHESYIGMIIFSGSTTIAGSLFILFSRLNIDPRPFVRV